MAALNDCDGEEEGERMCRYCFEGEEEGPLISPCACKGGQKWVHLSCLRRWQRMVLVSQPTHPAFYKDDIRHHECNVCKSQFTCPPPTRHELMQSFTGPEIAAFIERGSIIGSHPAFGAELEEQLAGIPAFARRASSYEHWIRGVYLITSVEADDGTLELPIKQVSLLARIRHVLLTGDDDDDDNDDDDEEEEEEEEEEDEDDEEEGGTGAQSSTATAAKKKKKEDRRNKSGGSGGRPMLLELRAGKKMALTVGGSLLTHPRTGAPLAAGDHDGLRLALQRLTEYVCVVCIYVYRGGRLD